MTPPRPARGTLVSARPKLAARHFGAAIRPFRSERTVVMIISSRLRQALAMSFGTAALAATLGTAQATVYNPPINMAHGIEYMSGGVGDDEAQLMQTVLPRWPASFVFTVAGQPAGEAATAVEVTVRSADGEVLIDHVRAGGPYMVARLEPGNYLVEAAWGGHTQTQQITVHAGVDTRTEFKWPEEAGVHSAHS